MKPTPTLKPAPLGPAFYGLLVSFLFFVVATTLQLIRHESQLGKLLHDNDQQRHTINWMTGRIEFLETKVRGAHVWTVPTTEPLPLRDHNDY